MSIYLPSPVRPSSTAYSDEAYMHGAPLARGAIVDKAHMIDGVYERRKSCGQCGAVFHSLLGLEQHTQDHLNGNVRIRPIVRYYVPRAQLDKLRAESKAAIREVKK